MLTVYPSPTLFPSAPDAPPQNLKSLSSGMKGREDLEASVFKVRVSGQKFIFSLKLKLKEQSNETVQRNTC